MSKVVTSLKGIVFIASNKGAGGYAYKMEFERGKSWRHLGIGSINKGGEVGGLFIRRGIQATQKSGRDAKAFDAALKRLKKDMEK